MDPVTQLETGPAVQPVSLEEAKAFLRVDGEHEDDLITGLIRAATTQAETITRRALITQTHDLHLGAFQQEISLPFGRLQSVTSITYTDPNGDQQTLDASVYDVDSNSEPGRVVLGYGKAWPVVRDHGHAVTVRFVVGFGDAATDVPEGIRAAIKIMVGNLYDNRSGPDPVSPGVDRLLATHRMFGF